jgi:hypothetical protein
MIHKMLMIHQYMGLEFLSERDIVQYISNQTMSTGGGQSSSEGAGGKVLPSVIQMWIEA